MAKAKAQIACGIKIAGSPEDTIEQAPAPETVAAMPEHIPLLKARLLAKTGDRIKIGTPLYQDKKDENIVFPSPGCGEIIDIRYGHRRVISEIVIRLDKKEDSETHRAYTRQELSGLGRDRLVKILLEAGLWPFIRDLVYRCPAGPKESPAAVWVGLDSLDPFHPRPHIYMKTEKDREYFETGLLVLQKLCDKVFVCKSRNTAPHNKDIEKHVTHRVPERYPAEEPGVVHYHYKTDPAENMAWFITGQDTVLLGEFMETGKFPVRRTVAVAGAQIQSRYVATRIGAPLKVLVREKTLPEQTRFIAGGLFRGYSVSENSYLGLYETGVFLAKEPGKRELLGFMRPGANKPTCSRAFLSVLNPRPMTVDTGIHGSQRACVNCGTCTRVCPVDILPQFTYKCILADDIEEALSHGLLDCVECGLCSYACPSKIELTQTFRQTKQAYFRGRI